MAHNKAREFVPPGRPGPIERREAASMASGAVDSDAFLEGAAAHLRDAGYTVELGFDEETGEACLYVEGCEVQFVRAGAGSVRSKPVRH